MYPNSLSLCCFHLGLVVEFIKELGGVSQAWKTFLFIYIVFSFLLIQAFKTSSLIYCLFFLVDLSFHNNFFSLSSLPYWSKLLEHFHYLHCLLLLVDPNFHNNFFFLSFSYWSKLSKYLHYLHCLLLLLKKFHFICKFLTIFLQLVLQALKGFW